MTTLYTSDYLEYYLTLVGWLIQNGIWTVLVASGLVAVPFIAIVVQEWLRARAEGADEGNKGVLSSLRIENRVWVAIVVIVFAGIPFIPVDLNQIQFDRTRSVQCQVTLALPNETQWEPAFTTLNNQTARVPIWWFFMHAVSKAVTGAASASIPCGTDLRQMRMDINATRIDDAVLSQEIADFTRDCYGLARAKLFINRPTLTDEQMADVNWIGSNYFTATPGFYDTYRSRTPRDAFPFDPARDVGLAEVPSGGGYPTCREWWLDANDGLRVRLLQQVSPDLLQRFERWAGFLTQAEVDDAVIRAVASPRQQIVNEGQVYTDYGGQIHMTVPNLATRIAADVGVTLGSLVAVPGTDAMRQALPMVLSMAKMALVICMPLLLLIGTYELKTVITVSCVEFAIFFTDFWFQLARWVDSTILNALYGWSSPHSNLNPLLGLNNEFQDMILNWFVLPMMFVILPMFWVGALTWVGVHAGAIAQALMTGTNDVKGAGNKGSGILIRAAGSKS
jgi:hypothetical protein